MIKTQEEVKRQKEADKEQARRMFGLNESEWKECSETTKTDLAIIANKRIVKAPMNILTPVIYDNEIDFMKDFEWDFVDE